MAIKVQAPFNLGSLGVCVRCCSLYAVECISRRSCPSLSRNHGRGAEIATHKSLFDFHTGADLMTASARRPPVPAMKEEKSVFSRHKVPVSGGWVRSASVLMQARREARTTRRASGFQEPRRRRTLVPLAVGTGPRGPRLPTTAVFLTFEKAILGHRRAHTKVVEPWARPLEAYQQQARGGTD